MTVFEEFENDLRDALAHLYDPTYQPSLLMWEVTGANPQQGVQPLQAILLQELERLKPSPNIPANARVHVIYEVLSCRYLQGLTQEEAAKCVGFTARTLRRVQQQAINLLAHHLWKNRHPEEFVTPIDIPPKNKVLPLDEDDEAGWRTQLKEELTFLQESSPGQVVNVGGIIEGALDVSRAVTSNHGVTLNADLPETPLLTTAHASILRQILIRGVGKMVHYMLGGEILIKAQQEGEYICICIKGYPVATTEIPYSEFIEEAATTQGGSLEIQKNDEELIYKIKLPSASNITVLVVDDNTDLVHFYQRYVAGTRYKIIHLAEGQRLFETIEEISPNIIVLDVMLPGTDGWELLTHLHETPHTRAIPVIVCSVIRGEEMALALGATLYLQKPIRSRQFIAALDQALN